MNDGMGSVLKETYYFWRFNPCRCMQSLKKTMKSCIRSKMFTVRFCMLLTEYAYIAGILFPLIRNLFHFFFVVLVSDSLIILMFLLVLKFYFQYLLSLHLLLPSQVCAGIIFHFYLQSPVFLFLAIVFIYISLCVLILYLFISIFVCRSSDYACSHNFHEGYQTIQLIQQLNRPKPSRSLGASDVVRAGELFSPLAL